MASPESAMMASAMMSPMMGMGMTKANPEEFKLLPVPNEKQVYVVPVFLSVYVEQDRIPDLLVEFSNSPMNIQIIEFAMYKAEPGAVEKPEKGGKQPGMANMRGMGMMDEMMMGYGMMPGMMAGGMTSAADQQMMMSMMAGGGMNSGMMPGMMPGMGMGTATAKKKGVDVRSETLAKLQGKEEETDEDEAKKKDTKPKVIDQYYNVVRVDLYGQARFFFPPPRPETPEPSESVSSELAGAEATPAEGTATESEPGTEVTEAPTPTEPGTEPTGDQPSADEVMPKPEPTPGAEPAAEVKDQPAPPSDSATPADADSKGEAKAEPKTDTEPTAEAAEPKTDTEPAPAPAPEPGAEPKAQ